MHKSEVLEIREIKRLSDKQKKHIINYFEFVGIFLSCFNHKTIKEFTDLNKNISKDLMSCSRCLFDAAKNIDGFFDDWSREYDLRRIMKLHNEDRFYEKAIEEIGIHAKDYFFKIFLEEGLISENDIKKAENIDTWEGLKIIYYKYVSTGIMDQINEELIKIKSKGIKKQVKNSIDLIIKSEKSYKEKYAYCVNIQETLRKIKDLLQMSNSNLFGVNINLDNISISIDKDGVETFNQRRY